VATWSLLRGWLPWVLTITGAVAFVGLLTRRDRGFWTRGVPIVLASTAAAVVVFDIVVEKVWQPFPDEIPTHNLVWGAAGLAAVALAAVRLPRLSWRSRPVAVVAALAVVITSAVQINVYWGAYPTVEALGEAAHNDSIRSLPGGVPTSELVTATPGTMLIDDWKPAQTLATQGVVYPVSIPGVLSRFPARSGYVYLPPAYSVLPRPVLPVVVLMAGQPGGPKDWITNLRLADTMNAFAQVHRGLAPIVVVVDDLGATMANPLCVDSRLGNAETYLAQDEPAWIHAHLQAATDRRQWFVGGYSHGGTCALQLAVRAPTVYGGFVDMSGQREPTLGNRASTVQRAFGGDNAAFTRVNPLDILKQTRFPTTVAFLAASSGDLKYLPQQLDVRAACQAAGMQVEWVQQPGKHNVTFWRGIFGQALSWISANGQLAER
jgi:S-formylglutathione hydrolase FrmB